MVFERWREIVCFIFHHFFCSFPSSLSSWSQCVLSVKYFEHLPCLGQWISVFKLAFSGMACIHRLIKLSFFICFTCPPPLFLISFSSFATHWMFKARSCDCFLPVCHMDSFKRYWILTSKCLGFFFCWSLYCFQFRSCSPLVLRPVGLKFSVKEFFRIIQILNTSDVKQMFNEFPFTFQKQVQVSRLASHLPLPSLPPLSLSWVQLYFISWRFVSWGWSLPSSLPLIYLLLVISPSKMRQACHLLQSLSTAFGNSLSL